VNFNYHLPVNLIFGRGRVSELGTQAARCGKRALVVTGRNSAKKTGLLDRALSYLSAVGLEYALFDEVEQNPLTTTVSRGVEAIRSHGCDVVIGLGGGSIMDAAKGMAFMAVNEGDISDYIFNVRTSDMALPIILVPTTCGTGSEGNGFAVLTNPETKDKKSLRCNAIIPKASIIDPELMTTMPKNLLASVGFDALCHCMEGYISRICSPMTEIIALEGIRMTYESLQRVYDDYSDMEAWERLTWGSTLGGMTLNLAGVTAAHGMEHPASGLRDIVHGSGLAALTPPVYRRSISGAPERFAVISRLMGGRDETDCVERIEILLERIGLTTSLGRQGLTSGDVDWMVKNCMKISAAGISGNPVVFTESELAEIYNEAM
jgi:alcohol dehydrogenase class IV